MLDLPFMIILLGVMFWYSWQLTLVSLTFLGLISLVSLLITPVYRHRLNQQFAAGAQTQSFITEQLSGIHTSKALQIEPHLQHRYRQHLGHTLHTGAATARLANLHNILSNVLDQLMTLVILVTGALLVMHQQLTIGMLVAYQMFAQRFSQPMLKLVGLWQSFQKTQMSARRLMDVLATPQEPYSLIPARHHAYQGAPEICLNGLGFRYSEHTPWLYQNLNHTFKPGSLTLVTGASGSGKSTLAKLLMGHMRPSEGNITLHGHDITHLSANELRQHIGIVLQETTLYSGTLYYNLSLANPQASFEDIVQAAKLADIHETIQKLPEGYQTKVGEHAATLSGGQKQRLAIARAILKRPGLLIMDEATANLDAHASEHIAQTMNQLKGYMTILFIAHHVPKGLKPDEVLVVGGKGQAQQEGGTRGEEKVT